MFLLFETIKMANGKPLNISYHNERMNRSRRELFHCKNELDLAELIQMPDNLSNDNYKCKVIYSADIQKIEWARYFPRKIERLKLVYYDKIEYSYKYLDRKIFAELLRLKNCTESEDILIIKDGRITDTSYSNVVFFNGKEWCTPQFPLLKGTKRAKLIKEKIIAEKDILVEDLKYYEKIILVNAMLDFDLDKSYLKRDFIIT